MCATDAAFHLVHKIDVEHTLARLAHYEALNKAHIAQHQQQREQESAQQDEADAVARHERMRRAQQVREEQEREQHEQDAAEAQRAAGRAGTARGAVAGGSGSPRGLKRARVRNSQCPNDTRAGVSARQVECVGVRAND